MFLILNARISKLFLVRGYSVKLKRILSIILLVSLNINLNGNIVEAKDPNKLIKKEILKDTSIIVHANRITHKYHYQGCKFYNCRVCTIVISENEAKRRGYKHCLIE